MLGVINIATGCFNISKGKQAYYASLPLGTDALECMLLSGTVVSAATMTDYATVAAILAGNTEAVAATNYGRIVVASGITVAPNNTTDVQTWTFTNPTWTSLGGVSNVVLNRFVVSYRATSGAVDSAKIPLTWYDIPALTTTGTNVTGTISTVLGTAA